MNGLPCNTPRNKTLQIKVEDGRVIGDYVIKNGFIIQTNDFVDKSKFNKYGYQSIANKINAQIIEVTSKYQDAIFAGTNIKDEGEFIYISSIFLQQGTFNLYRKGEAYERTH